MICLARSTRLLRPADQQESADPLMLCVSAPDNPSYEEAKLGSQLASCS